MITPLSKKTLHSYSGPRHDLQRLVPTTATRILDVGCGPGTLGEALQKRQACEVDGIEPHPSLSPKAATVLRRVLPVTIETALGQLKEQGARYDVIIFGDVLEHLVDPWLVLRDAAELLAEGGSVVASLPNVRHLDTVFNLVFRGTWPLRERGIHDRTHLRFFTRSDIEAMIQQAGLRIERTEPNYRLFEAGHRWNVWAPRLAIWPWRDFLVFQYVLRAVKA